MLPIGDDNSDRTVTPLVNYLLIALNVAVLQLNVRLDRLGRERATLRDENAALEARSSSAKATVQARAKQRLGLVPATNPTYVDLRKR